MYNIRFAKEKDAKQMLKLLYEIAKIHNIGRPDLFKENAVKYNESSVIKLIQDENKPIFVMVDENDNLIGYCICEIQITEENILMYGKKILYIDDLCINDNFRGQKCGGELFLTAKKYAKENLFDKVELNVWRFNEGAIRFYERQGMNVKKQTMEINL